MRLIMPWRQWLKLDIGLCRWGDECLSSLFLLALGVSRPRMRLSVTHNSQCCRAYVRTVGDKLAIFKRPLTCRKRVDPGMGFGCLIFIKI